MIDLTIEILDSASGKMAAGVSIEIRKIENGNWVQLEDAQTGSDGKAVLCDAPTIADGGYFEVLVFLGAYFDQTGRDLPQIKMVDIVPLRFGLEPVTTGIDLRMTISPTSYSTAFSTRAKRLNLV